MASPSPLPPGLGVEIDRAVRLADEGHVLVGGSPPRALRLTPAQLSAVIRWSSGSAPSGLSERLLARALIEGGLAHPRPLPPVPWRPAADVAVAVVGQAGAGGLTRTLDRLAELHPDLRPVVVGATGPAARVARARGARVVPGPVGGPEARAEALRVSAAEFVALLESGSCPAPGWLDAALGHFTDPGVAAVVPRVLSERPRAAGPWRRTVAAVAAVRAGADRGADPAPVLPWGQGPGQPGAGNEHTAADPLRPLPALVLRRSALGGRPQAAQSSGAAAHGRRRGAARAGPALSPELGAGAELDLVWRLADQGWTVRYEPRSRLRSRPVTDLGGYLRACFAAGALVAPLARRHDRRAAGPELSPEGMAGLVLAASGRPGAGAALATLTGAAVVREEPGGAPPPWPETVRAVAGDVAHTARLGARALRETWWPVAASAVLACALRRERGARRIALVGGAALVLPHLAAWRTGRGAVLVGPLTWTALGMAGDAARSAGTWWGVARTGSIAPLVPRLRARARVRGALPESPDVAADAHSRVKTLSLLLVDRG